MTSWSNTKTSRFTVHLHFTHPCLTNICCTRRLPPLPIRLCHHCLASTSTLDQAVRVSVAIRVTNDVTSVITSLESAPSSSSRSTPTFRLDRSPLSDVRHFLSNFHFQSPSIYKSTLPTPTTDPPTTHLVSTSPIVLPCQQHAPPDRHSDTTREGMEFHEQV